MTLHDFNETNKLNEMKYNQADKEAIKNAQPNLDKAIEEHKLLMKKEIIPQRKQLQSKLDTIENQEDGQGQRYDDIEELKSKIKILDIKTAKSQDNVDRLTRIRNEIIKMSKN